MATPKAKLNQIYTASADGLPQYFTFAEGACTFYCKIELPNGIVVVSQPCRRKKDAEHDASRKALQELGTPFESEIFGTIKSHDDVWLELKLRIETAFSNECVLNYKPLMEHFRAAIVRRGKNHAPVPATVLASLDTKIISMCKTLDNISDGNPARALELVYAAAQASSVLTCDANLWISRLQPFPAHVKAGLLGETSDSEGIQFQAVYIPCSLEQNVQAMQITVNSDDYYMDVLARKLGIKDGGHVLISRSISKAPSGTRLFWGLSSPCEKRTSNVRAGTVTSHPVYGNAILASVGSTWKSEGKLCYDDVSLGCYYRLILGKYPTGSYKLSRAAVLTAELPPTFTSKARWRGPTPRSILNEFCHQSHLFAPTFCTYPVKGDSNEPCTDFEAHGCTSDAADQAEASGDMNFTQGPFMCKLRMVVGGVAREFESERSFRSRNDAIQSACLKALVHFDSSISHLLSKSSVSQKEQRCTGESDSEDDTKQPAFEIISGAEKAGDRPPIGSMVHVDYSVRITEGYDVNVEVQTNFEFELGSGAVLGAFDACITGMCVGQTARFSAPLPSEDLLLATESIEAAKIIHLSKGCLLEYTVTLQNCVEAAEARMESAVFSPPLSKQRIDFALQLFQRSEASSLIDLGCGSGSFLEAILEQPNALQRIVGVDISPRSLTRASKSLMTKLSKRKDLLQTVELYEGSIAEPDYLFRNFDVATCLEVVEHMDPDPLSKFGESVLGVMSPKILLVSTPNIEYNPILHGIVSRKEKGEGWEESSKAETDEASSIRLRNDDHRFEWTRAEFGEWASTLARRHGYSVEYSGVGGTPGQEPGFASQIAIFSRNQSVQQTGDDEAEASSSLSSSYSEIWRWTSPPKL